MIDLIYWTPTGYFGITDMSSPGYGWFLLLADLILNRSRS